MLNTRSLPPEAEGIFFVLRKTQFINLVIAIPSLEGEACLPVGRQSHLSRITAFYFGEPNVSSSIVNMKEAYILIEDCFASSQ
jgi:hypothetical protein